MAAELEIILKAKDEASKAFKKASGNLDKATSTIKRNSESFKKAGAAMTAAGAAGAAGLGMMISKASDFEEAMVEVQKVTSPDEANSIGAAIKDLGEEIPIARTELAGMAADAARFGVKGTDNILAFTSATAKMATATDLSADQAGTAFAKIAELTGTPIPKVENLGSAINELSNNFATSSSEIVESALRSAGSLTTLGLSQTEIMGLSAAFNEVSESSQRAGTRLMRLSQQMMKPSKQADIADALGMTADQFDRLAKTSPVKAIRQMAQAMGEGGEKADALKEVLATPVRRALADLSKNLEGVDKALAMSGEAFEENTSLQKEFEAATKTFKASLVKLTNTFGNLTDMLFKTVRPALDKTVGVLKSLLERFQDLPGPVKKATLGFGTFSTAVAAIGGPMLLLIGYIPQLVTGLGNLKTAAYAAGRALNWAFVKTKWGLVLAGIATAISLIATNLEKVKKAADKIAEPFRKLRDVMPGFLKHDLEIVERQARDTADATKKAASSTKGLSIAFDVLDSTLGPAFKMMRGLAKATRDDTGAADENTNATDKNTDAQSDQKVAVDKVIEILREKKNAIQKSVDAQKESIEQYYGNAKPMLEDQRTLVERATDAFEEQKRKLADWRDRVKSSFDAAKSKIEDYYGTAKEIGKKAQKSLAQIFRADYDRLVGEFKSALDKRLDYLNEYYGNIEELTQKEEKSVTETAKAEHERLMDYYQGKLEELKKGEKERIQSLKQNTEYSAETQKRLIKETREAYKGLRAPIIENIETEQERWEEQKQNILSEKKSAIEQAKTVAQGRINQARRELERKLEFISQEKAKALEAIKTRKQKELERINDIGAARQIAYKSELQRIQSQKEAALNALDERIGKVQDLQDEIESLNEKSGGKVNPANVKGISQAPSMQTGGIVPSTGVYRLHQGETIVPAPQVNASPHTSVIIPIYLDGRQIATYTAETINKKARLQGAYS